MSNEKYIIQEKPFIVPTTDGKLIEEFFGNASINVGDFSIAHMIAPAGWSEPFQKPEFDEITYIIRGKKKIEIDDEEIILDSNKSIWIKKGTRIRYSNPFSEECEYISFCFPAFSIEKVNREN